MMIKHLPPDPSPSHADRTVRAHNLETGRSYLAVARQVLRSGRIQLAATTTIAVAERRARAPPVAEMDRADGCVHRPVSTSTQSATVQEEGV
jgi:hypothetical protein